MTNTEPLDLDAIEARAAWAGYAGAMDVKAVLARFQIAREDVPALVAVVRERDEKLAKISTAVAAGTYPNRELREAIQYIANVHDDADQRDWDANTPDRAARDRGITAAPRAMERGGRPLPALEPEDLDGYLLGLLLDQLASAERLSALGIRDEGDALGGVGEQADRQRGAGGGLVRHDRAVLDELGVQQPGRGLPVLAGEAEDALAGAARGQGPSTPSTTSRLPPPASPALRSPPPTPRSSRSSASPRRTQSSTTPPSCSAWHKLVQQ